MQAYVDGVKQSSPPLAGDPHPIYVLFLPPGVVPVRGGVLNTGCAQWDGTHNSYGPRTQRTVLAVLQRCTGGTEDDWKRLTAIASHEIEEAATDPFGTGYTFGVVPATMPWAADTWHSFASEGEVETADLCEGARVQEGAFWYQRNWSNAAAAAGGDPCVPAAPTPYFSVSPAAGWTAATPGQIVSVPLDGWSTGPIDDWQVTGSVERASPGLIYRWQIVGATTVKLGGKTYATVNNGRRAQLEVTFDAATAPGAFIILRIFSGRRTADGALPTDADRLHPVPVGVYVK
jgi:hypothetical protein